MCLNYLAQCRHSKNSTYYHSCCHLACRDSQLGSILMTLDFIEWHTCTCTYMHIHKNTQKHKHICYWKWGLPPCHLKANTWEARLVERKVCSVLDASSCGEGGLLSKGRLPPSHPHDNQWARAFIGWGRGLHAETTQSALTLILKLVMQWSNQHHLDCFLRTVNLQFQGLFVPISLRPVPWNCSSLWHGYGLVIM